MSLTTDEASLDRRRAARSDLIRLLAARIVREMLAEQQLQTAAQPAADELADDDADASA